MNNLQAEKAKRTLENFKNKKVVVIGDFYLDEYIHTTSEEYSPEAPVPRAIIQSKEYMPGAAGNVAVGFSALGANVVSIGVIGDDHNGRILIRELKKMGVDVSCLVVDKNRVTGTFSRILIKCHGDLNQHVIRVDHENKEKLSSRTREAIHTHMRSKLKDCDAVFIADYDEAKGTGLINHELIESIVNSAKANKVLTVGTSRLNISHFKGVDVIIANKKESMMATNIKINDDKSLKITGNKMMDLLKSKMSLITLGKQGLIAFENADIVRLPSFAQKVDDVCGAGDSLSVALCLSKLSGANLKESCEIASFAAAVAVSKQGTASVSTEEIENAILNISGDSNKLFELDKLLPILQNAKKKGKKIVFTNGYFDLIHVGHINFLQEAKKLGDILVLAINSDESTKANKGANRPIINQEDRARILSGFSFIDFVTIFNELTPIKTIKVVQPDILAKGGSYSEDEVVGNEIVKAAGGNVVIIPTLGPSTERLFDHIKNSKKYLHEK